MAAQKTGAIIVLQRNNALDFLISKENRADMTLSPQLLQTLFFKNSPLHDGAVLLNNNKIVATRVVLPVSESQQFPSKYGLRHRAALGITEKTDALVIVISEQTGKITYVKNSEFETLKSVDQLKSLLQHDLSL